MFQVVKFDGVELAKVMAQLDAAIQSLKAQSPPPDSPTHHAITRITRAVGVLQTNAMDLPSLIRECAGKGMGRKETMQALRMTRYRFNLLVDAMPDIQWVSPAKTAGRQAYNRSLIGSPVAAIRNANLRKGADKATENKRIHVVEGVRGTIKELYDHFRQQLGPDGKPRVKVSYGQVANRFRKGTNVQDGNMSIEDALFLGRRPSAVDNCAGSKANREKYKAHIHHSFSQQGARP